MFRIKNCDRDNLDLNLIGTAKKTWEQSKDPGGMPQTSRDEWHLLVRLFGRQARTT